MDKWGGVHRLNQHQLEDIERRFAAPEPGSLIAAGGQSSQWALPARVTELRASVESGQERREKFWLTLKDLARDRRKLSAAEPSRPHAASRRAVGIAADRRGRGAGDQPQL